MHVQVDTRQCPKTLDVATIFQSPPWSIPEMMAVKDRLNKTKDKMDTMDIKCAPYSRAR